MTEAEHLDSLLRWLVQEEMKKLTQSCARKNLLHLYRHYLISYQYQYINNDNHHQYKRLRQQ